MVVQTFEAWPFHPDEDGNVCDLLRLALVTRGASRIYELRENHHADHEIEAEAIEPVYWGGWEGIWTDNTFEWLVYADHESAVTVAGGGLLADLKDVWPDWRKCVYHEM